jgi:nucleoside-diphosphate-sugar epimerase
MYIRPTNYRNFVWRPLGAQGLRQTWSKTMPHPTERTALVIGAAGAFGRHAAQALARRGWRIRALARDPNRAQSQARDLSAEWVQGDAMDAASVIAAAQGVSLIFHGANPPGYRNWKGTVLPMAESAIAAARASGARLVIPASVYNFAPDAGPAIAEDTPQAPATRKGALRVEMEQRLRAAANDGVKVLILRAGDFFGPETPGALDWLTVRRGGKLRSIYAPGPAPHAFAYLPDLSETLARLVEREEELANFEVFHFRGHWLERSDDLAQAIRRAIGRPDLPVRAFPWLVVWALSPFVETLRELIEMRYLWRRPIGLDNAKLVRFLGAEPHTPLDVAIRASLASMGVLQSAPEPASRSSSAMAPTM